MLLGPREASSLPQAPLVEAGMPRVSLYLGLGVCVCVCVKALAYGARGWFSPGYVAVGAGGWELCGRSSTQGLSCLTGFATVATE